MFDVSKAFDTSSETVLEFFQRPGVGYYIPLYQRDYSWDKENIDQLMEDICRGVESLTLDDDVRAIRFLGTIIILLEKDPRNNIKPQDRRALPEKIFNVIDGQQRISTIALLSCLLYQKIYELKIKLPQDKIYNGLREAVERCLLNLLDIFSVDLKRGSPSQKPVIIRGSIDGWTYDGDDHHYQSEISLFLSQFIRSAVNEDEKEFPQIPGKSLSAENLKRIKYWLKFVENAHKKNVDSENFSPAWKILERIPQRELWSYERPELVELVKQHENPISKNTDRVYSLIQLMTFCYYLFNRCCFTLIEPKSEDWAFDMFQSLNATGTPLTAIETFKPLVVNHVNSNNSQFKDSPSEKYFSRVDRLFSSVSSASQKNKLTNEYLTMLGLIYDGGKQPHRQFSSQRQWLTKRYKECESTEAKETFILLMSDLAQYWEEVICFRPDAKSSIQIIEGVKHQERQKAELCILYLQDAGHKMAHTILSRFYSLCLRKKVTSEENFVVACQAVAAFFTLWRSALPNTGLDEVYRKVLREKMSWKASDIDLSVQELKIYFKEILKDKEIESEEKWRNKAVNELKYNQAKVVCKFALFIASEDTIPDEDNPGLMKKGTSGSSPSYLEPNQWVSQDFKTLEHIAPRQPQRSNEVKWSTSLYENDDYEKVGNLTLLPVEINSSANNKGWINKWIYYLHLAEKDPVKLKNLSIKAEEYGVKLNTDTINRLQTSNYNHHISSIVKLGPTGTWDSDFVNKRTDRICHILWQRMNEWLN